MSDNDQPKLLEMTSAAVDKIAELMATRAKGPQAVRVVVHNLGQPGGGQSEFKFVAPGDRNADDTILEMGPFPLYLDPQAALALQGATVDFDEKRYANGFHIEYENPLVAYLESRRKQWDDPVAIQVQQLVDEQINPGVAGHGGWVVLLDVKKDTAYIEMGGGCRGCAISHMTLKQGIERIIMEEVPEIKQVVDTTDHAGGTNPYYEGAASGDSPLG